MQVILLDKIRNLGGLGDQVNVKPGYARNFLFPSKKAVPANEAHIAEFEARRKELELAQSDKLEQAQARARNIEELASVNVSAHASDEGKLFGSVGTRDIATIISDAGVPVEKNEVSLSQGSLREIGEHVVQLQLHADVKTQITVIITAQS